MILAKLIFWFIVFSMISILILMGLGRNVHQAVQIVASFWKSIFIDLFNELFGTGKAYYPLVFGIGKDGYFYPSMIDSAFKDFYELFGGKKIFIVSMPIILVKILYLMLLMFTLIQRTNASTNYRRKWKCVSKLWLTISSKNMEFIMFFQSHLSILSLTMKMLPLSCVYLLPEPKRELTLSVIRNVG